MSGAATTALASQAGDVAKGAGQTAEAASDSSGFNILLVLAGLALAYYALKAVNTGTEVVEEGAEGAGDAGQAVGETAGDAYEGAADAASGAGQIVGDIWGGGQDVARGTGDFVTGGVDWALGGTADTIEDTGGALGGLIP